MARRTINQARRIAILGCCGAGKSTLALELGERLGLPVYHLDVLYWRPGWQDHDPDQWPATVARVVERDEWIIDGNYSATMDMRLARAEAVIFLDFPRRVCIWRAIRRWLQQRGRSRPDMAPGCPEKMDLEFLRWIWDFRRRSRPGVISRLENLRPEVTTVTLGNARAVTAWLANLPE